MTAVSMLPTFKIKIEEAVTLLPTMLAEERLEAVRFFTMAESMMLQQLQDIIAKTAADLSVLLANNSNQESHSDETNMENGEHDSHSVDAGTLNDDVVMENMVKMERMDDTEDEDESHNDLVIVANDLKVELVEDSEDFDVDLSETDGNEGLRIGEDEDEWDGTDNDKLMQQEQQETSVDFYQCIICKKQFRLASTLLAHMASHTESHDGQSFDSNDGIVIKDYICEKCGRGFQLESSLMHHMERHRNKLRFIPYNKLPPDNRSLEPSDSSRIHSSTRTFSCPQCGNSFVTQEKLISHMYKHDVTTTVKYDLSNKAFSSKVPFQKT